MNKTVEFLSPPCLAFLCAKLLWIFPDAVCNETGRNMFSLTCSRDERLNLQIGTALLLYAAGRQLSACLRAWVDRISAPANEIKPPSPSDAVRAAYAEHGITAAIRAYRLENPGASLSAAIETIRSFEPAELSAG